MRVSTRVCIAAASVVAAVVVPMSAAGAQVPPYTDPNPPETSPREVERDPSVQPAVEVQGSSSLPVTGSDVVGLVLVGGTLTAGGLVLRGAARRRTAAGV